MYLADLTSGGDAANPRRFTLDDSDDFATNWMPDSGAILFSSNRNGNLDIFRQSLDGRIAEAVVAGPDDESGPTAVSPDGTWFYYYLHPKGWRSTMARGLTIMRTPVSGGARQKIADDSGRRKVLCARSPSTTCVLVEHEGKQFGIYALDPLQGKGRTIMTTELESSATYWYADLSRDGLALAILIPNENRIRSCRSRVRHRVMSRSLAGHSTLPLSTGRPMVQGGMCRARQPGTPVARTFCS